MEDRAADGTWKMEDLNDKMEEGRPLISFAKKTEDCDVQLHWEDGS